VTIEGETILLSESAIAQRVGELADRIASAQTKPEIAVPVLLGGFVFAADLLRALAMREVALQVEFIRLVSYNAAGGASGEAAVRIGPSEAVRNKHVLLIDGVLDSGATLAKAREMLCDAGARSIITAVAVAKKHSGRSIEADYAGFEAGPEFLYGYGMDRAGFGRGLPDIRIARDER
jgi:hypoxanthine phosphoribosyltransferase